MIVGMVKNGLGDERYPSARAMAEELGVSWRTVMRDLDYLRDYEGAPIEYDASRKGYYLSSNGWSLQPVTLTHREILAFALASRMFHPFRGTPMEEDLRSLFGKIDRALDGTAAVSMTVNPDQVSFLSDDYVPLNHTMWTRLAGHIEQRDVIHTRYRTFSGEVKSYRLAPIHLTAYHGNWYVVAFRENRPEPTTFALSRFISLRKSTVVSWAPGSFDAAAYAHAAFGITRGEKEIKVHLRFSPSISTYVAERIWHPTQVMKKRKNGSVDMRFTTRGWKELVRWILSWQPDVVVVAPQELRERVIEKLKQGLEAS